MNKSSNVFSGLITNVKTPDYEMVHDFDWSRPPDVIPGRQYSSTVSVEMETWDRAKSIGRAFVCPVATSCGARDHDRLRRLIETAYAVEDVLTGWTNAVEQLALWVEVLNKSAS